MLLAAAAPLPRACWNFLKSSQEAVGKQNAGQFSVAPFAPCWGFVERRKLPVSGRTRFWPAPPLPRIRVHHSDYCEKSVCKQNARKIFAGLFFGRLGGAFRREERNGPGKMHSPLPQLGPVSRTCYRNSLGKRDARKIFAGPLFAPRRRFSSEKQGPAPKTGFWPLPRSGSVDLKSSQEAVGKRNAGHFRGASRVPGGALRRIT